MCGRYIVYTISSKASLTIVIPNTTQNGPNVVHFPVGDTLGICFSLRLGSTWNLLEVMKLSESIHWPIAWIVQKGFSVETTKFHTWPSKLYWMQIPDYCVFVKITFCTRHSNLFCWTSFIKTVLWFSSEFSSSFDDFHNPFQNIFYSKKKYLSLIKKIYE